MLYKLQFNISSGLSRNRSPRAFSSEVDTGSKTRQNKNLEPRSDPIGTEKALGNEGEGRPCGNGYEFVNHANFIPDPNAPFSRIAISERP